MVPVDQSVAVYSSAEEGELEDDVVESSDVGSVAGGVPCPTQPGVSLDCDTKQSQNAW